MIKKSRATHSCPGSLSSVFPVDEEEFSCGPRDGRVEPSVVFLDGRVFRHKSLFDEDVGPLAALRLVAGDSIGIFELQRIEIRILPEFFDALWLLWDVHIVLHHLIIKPVVLLGCQRRGLRLQGVKQHGGLQLEILVVRESEYAVG